MSAADPTPAGTVAALEARVAALEQALRASQRRILALEDVEAIKRLQRIYGYYLDKALWDQAIPLFTDDCEIEISGRGVYRGHAGADTMFRILLGEGRNGLAPGRLLNHMQLQGVVHLGEQGDTAQGRWRAFIQAATVGQRAIWAEGVYEMRYAKVGVQWRIQRLHWFATYYTPFDAGWKQPSLPLNAPSAEYPPDAPPTLQYGPYPEPFVPPFHYPNPVTGQAFGA
jgi:hypothetical protein